MKRILSPFIVTLIVIIACFFTSRSNAQQQKTQNRKQLNISILLDLSDRINPTRHPSKPEHFERDISIIEYFTEYFKKDMMKRGVFRAKGRLKVIFCPRPNDAEINEIASELKIGLAHKNPKEKKQIFDNISNRFKNNLTKIYSRTIKTNKYPGSDIWRFFKNDVRDFCIDDSGKYRNILVIITDGYIFHVDSKDKKEHRSQFLTPKYIHSQRKYLSGDINTLRKHIKKYDYGYITTRNDLGNLEILVLEISPIAKRKNDEDIIKEYLRKWFTEMNVKNFSFYNTDLPEYTKERIEKFLNRP